ncbi:MAG: OstA-like protein [Sphingobacterium sp.]
MRHLFIFIMCLLSLGTYGQSGQESRSGQPTPMYLKSSTVSGARDQGVFWSVNPVYEHQGSTLASDSGKLYTDEIGNEFFEAHGNIVITQPSGTIIRGTHLHYDASSQHAILTENARMIDGQTTLTTDYLTYNLRSERGTYQHGGRIVGQGDTITSQKAYYFERTKDAYFNEKVVVRSQSVIIYTDTMQYNTTHRDAYFFGPTNINGRAGETLYTEKGTYNTGTGIAKFNKNNLYTEDSRFLKGDSLYYDRDSGIGEAFRNVLFVDTLDKFYASGQYGKYLESDQSILMTDQPLIKYVVRSDSAGNQSDSTAVDSVATAPEELSSRKRRQRERASEKEKELNGTVKDTVSNQGMSDMDTIPPPIEASEVDTAYMTADTLFSKVILVSEYRPLDLKLDRDGGQIDEDQDVDYGNIDELELFGTAEGEAPDGAAVDSTLNETDSVGIDAQQVPDSTMTSPPDRPFQITPPDSLEEISKINAADSLLRQNAVMPTGNEHDSLMNDALRVVTIADTILKDSSEVFSDTARTRIVEAYYNVRVFKSDLQAVADSVYYGMADSMFRFMGDPMIWSEGSQISADTIYMQLKNGTMDNALLKDNAFMVNAVLDTAKFNQLKGRKITAFFANNNMDRIFVDGNAENLVFSTNDETNTITEMFYDRSSRIKVRMEGEEIVDYVSIRKVDQKVYPFRLVTQENEVLPGFVWKPQDRPQSLEDMLTRKRIKVDDTNPSDEEGEDTADESEGSISQENQVETEGMTEEASESVQEEETSEEESASEGQEMESREDSKKNETTGEEETSDISPIND